LSLLSKKSGGQGGDVEADEASHRDSPQPCVTEPAGEEGNRGGRGNFGEEEFLDRSLHSTNWAHRGN